MLKPLLLAGLAAAAFAPSLASAQCQGNDNRAVGTVLGAVGGALLGNAIGEHGGKTGGTIIGGVGGAVVGNRLAGGSNHCGSNQFGYYDSNGQWVPRTSNASGYYDANGRWVYTSNSYAQPAYAPAYGRDAAYSDRTRWTGAPLDVRARENWLDQSIRSRMANGTLDPYEGRQALRELRNIRSMDANERGYSGHLTYRQTADIQARLDNLRARISTDSQVRSY